MRFRAHETFFIRKGWLSKGMKSIVNNPSVFMGIDNKGSKINPMDVLGIGANMVKSLRYWLQVVGLTKEPESGRKFQTLTPLGELVFYYDPYIEEMGTLSLLHYNLCSNKDHATAWYYFFNEFTLRSFSRDDFVSSITGYIQMNNESVSTRSLEDDFNCIIGTYISSERRGNTRVSPENNIDCPFGELELLEVDNKKARTITYRKKSASKVVMPSLIALALIIHMPGDNQEIPIGTLLSGQESIGKAFNFDTIALSSLLLDLESLGYLKIIRTAGLDVVRLESNLTYQACIEQYYKSISRG